MRHINVDLLKRVHTKILRFGKKISQGYHFLGGLYAHKSRDGFLIGVSDAYNVVRVDLDRKVKGESVSNDHQAMFLRKVKNLDQRFN